MVNKIKKRDGSIVDFDKYKIFNAIAKANISVNYELTDNNILMITDEVVSQIDESNNSVEQIQDLVEDSLIKHNFKKTAKEYIIYRENHNKIRNNESFLMDIYKKITSTNIEENDILRENANINAGSSMGSMLKYGSEGSKFYIDNYVLPKDIALAHQEGSVHLHDKDFYMLTETCCQIELDKLFKKGFNTGYGTIRPPQSIESASSLTCVIIQANQNEMHGGQSIPALDHYLAPYVRLTYKKELMDACLNYLTITYEKFNITEEEIINRLNILFDNYDFKLPKDNYNIDEEVENIFNKLNHDANINQFTIPFMLEYAIPKALSKTDKRTHQAMESLIHNLNSLASRAGSQVPFSSVNYGTDTSPEGRMVIKNILKSTEEGLGAGETPIFPVQVFKLRDGYNYNKKDPNYDLFKYAMRVSSKRLFPNFNSLMSSFNKPYLKENDPNHEVSVMGAVSQGYVKLYLPNNPIRYCTVEISYLYTFLKKHNLCSELLTFDPHTKYVNVNEDEVFIEDSKSNKKYAKLKKWMVFDNPDNNWYKLQVKDWYTNYFTDDHPLHIYDTTDNKDKRKLIKDIINTDKVCIVDEDNDIYYENCLLEKVNDKLIGYDVETESDRFNIYVEENDSSSLIGLVSHNCRTRVMGNIYDPTKEVTGSRGNLSFTTINLPRLGILANKDIDKFFTLLDEKIDLCFRQLLHRLSIQKKRRARNYPFLMLNGVWIDSEKLDPDDEVGDILNHGTLSIGFIGLAETLVALIGKHHGESDEAQELGLRIVKHMRDRCDQKSQETKLNFTLIGSPSESTCGRLQELNRKKFGIIPGVTDREYMTNSSHIPVYYNISAFKKIEKEAPYHKYCNAGSILYLEQTGDIRDNLEAFEKLIRYMVENDAGYMAINHPVDRDPICGYTGIINDVCPRCGRREGEGIPLSKLKELRKKYPNVPLPKEVSNLDFKNEDIVIADSNLADTLDINTIEMIKDAFDTLDSQYSNINKKENIEEDKVSFAVKMKRVEEAIDAFSKNPPEWWDSIMTYRGGSDD